MDIVKILRSYYFISENLVTYIGKLVKNVIFNFAINLSHSPTHRFRLLIKNILIN